ncbi:MAG: cystathionine gamma-synthase [Alphaproteobacteria bacterium]|nr:cystathionine gamma-synthase [Alphaproteobacteria bacterium]
MDKKHWHRRTNAVQAGIGSDPAYHAVMPPLYMSSTFAIDGIGHKPAYEYSRTRNPTRDDLAQALAELEGGVGACVTSSGMAALTLLLHLLGPEDLLVAPYDCYGRSYRLLCALAEKKHFRLQFADQYSPEGIAAMFEETPKMILIESPSNPVMRIADIGLIAEKASACGAWTVVDNTFLSPMLQNPLKLGADMVFHSTTKFLNGHSDIVGGCVVAGTKEILTDLEFWANSLGVIGAPFDSYMTLRGMRTLELRVHRAQENAGIIAAQLEAHPSVRKVYYPGLASHTGHEIAAKQQEGFGAMLSFELEGGIEAVDRFVRALSVFRLAQSLGGTESLVNHPATMTHVSMGPEARAKAGVTDELLRLSVGVEHIDDLRQDLEAALQAAS